MSYNIRTYPPFDRAIKRLNKRYKSLKADLLKLIAELQENPQMGADLGKGFRKVRMQISAKGKGKSGGARVITYIVRVSEADAAKLKLGQSLSPKNYGVDALRGVDADSCVLRGQVEGNGCVLRGQAEGNIFERGDAVSDVFKYNVDDGVEAVATFEGKLVAVVRIDNRKIAPVRVFNL